MQNKDIDYCDMTMTENRVHEYHGKLMRTQYTTTATGIL